MNRLFLLASCLSALFVHGTALALPSSSTFGAFVDEGWGVLAPVGTLQFELIEEQVGMLGNGWAVMCRYLMEWQVNGGVPYSTYCLVDEPTWFGHADCLQNSQSVVHGLVMRVPSSPCAGFDANGVAHNIFQLTLGEGDVALDGLIQYTAASARVYGFSAVARG